MTRRPSVGGRLVAIVALAFVLRLVWVLTTTRAPVFAESGDAYSYFFYGRQLAEGGGYLNLDGSGNATAYYPPGYPAILGALFWVLLHTPVPDGPAALAMAGSLLHVVLGTASVGLTFVVARTTVGERTALVSAGLLAVWPNVVFYTSTLQLETVFVFVALAALAIPITHDWSNGAPGVRRMALFGGALAGACLVRPFAAPFVVVPAIAALVAGAGIKRSAIVAVSALVPFAVLLVPWTLRNQRAVGAALPFSSNTGDTVCLDRSLDAEGGFRFADHQGCADPDLDEVERNRESTSMALEFVREHPDREALQIVRRLRLIFGNDNDGLYAVERGTNNPFLADGLRTTLRRVADGFFFVVLALAIPGLVGLVMTLRSLGRVAAARSVLVVGPLLALTATAALLWGTPRFHQPMTPFLAILAAAVVAGATNRRSGRLRRTGNGNTPGMRRSTLVAGLVLALAAAPLLGEQAPSAAPARATSSPGTGPTASNERWALIVGITDYAGRTASTAAGAPDAADFREVLLRNGFAADHIVTLTEQQATAANIRNGLQWLVDRSSPDAFSVFHYSGHVKQMSGDRDRDGEKLDEFLWPHDNRFIADAELADYSRRLQGLAWFDIAGCEAAGFDDGISGPRRLFTASSRETEKSYEHPEWRNSIFVGLQIDQAFLQGMGDGDGNGKVSIQEAFAFAAERAPQMTKRQRRGPQHPVGAGGEGPQWYLDGPPAPEPPPPPPSSPPPPPPDEPCRQLFCLT